MKKLVLSIAMVVASVLSINAQNQEAGTFSLTPTLGAGITAVSNGGDTMTNGSLNVEGRYQFSNLFGMSVGVGYDYQLSTEKDPDGHYFEMGHVTVPVLAHFNLGNHFSVHTGVKTSFLTQAESGNYNYKSLYESTTVQIPVGVTYTFNKPWVLSLNYDIPVSNQVKTGSNKFHEFTLTFGYRFDLGK